MRGWWSNVRAVVGLRRLLRRAARRQVARADLVYVIGPPRSGTTVTGDLLSTADGVLHLGEVRGVLESPARFTRVERRCGCGDPVPECAFWSPLVGADRAVDLEAVLDRASALGASTVVDSSKRLGSFLRVLQADARLRGVVVCHRGFVDFLRSRFRHGRRLHGRGRLVVAMGPDVLRWIGKRVAGLAVEVAARGTGVPVVRSTPELVATDPAALLGELAGRLGLDLPELTPGTRRFHTGTQHVVWGSPTRIRPDGWLTVSKPRAPGSSGTAADDRRGGAG